MECYLGLGSNIGDRLMMLQSAIDMISAIPGTHITKCSGVYETEPWGYKEQPSFFNACIICETDQSIQDLFIRLKRIESELGRTPSQRNYPRLIDIDLLLCDHSAGTYGDVVIPHSSMHLRRFVLEPLSEIAPDFIHPVFQRAISEMLTFCSDDGRVQKIKDRLVCGNTNQSVHEVEGSSDT